MLYKYFQKSESSFPNVRNSDLNSIYPTIYSGCLISVIINKSKEIFNKNLSNLIKFISCKRCLHWFTAPNLYSCRYLMI